MALHRRTALSALLAIVMMIGPVTLAGCSGSDTPDVVTTPVSNEADASGLSGSIRFSTWGSESEIETNKKVIEAFEAAYPGTSIELEYIPEDYETKIETLIAGGAAPDVIYGHPKQLRKWFALGALADLVDLYEVKGFNDDSLYNTSFYENFEYEGAMVGTINGQDILLLFYNKELFDAAGIEYPTEDWTWDEFLEASKELTIKEGDRTTQYGVTVSSWYPQSQMFIWSFGGEVLDDIYANDARVTVESPESADGLEFMQSLVHEHGVAPTPEAQQIFGGSFEAGNVAMKFDGAWAPVFLKDIDGLDWDMMVVPKGPAGRHTAVLYAGYGVSNTSKNPELAREFAAFMQSFDGQKILAETGLITVIHRDVSEDPSVLGAPGMPPGNAYRVSGVDDARWRDAAPLWWQEALDKGYTPELEALLAGTQDAATTVTNMQKLMSEVRDANQ